MSPFAVSCVASLWAMAAPSGHVVIACDKFKGSLTASEVVEAIRTGIAAAAPEREVRAVLVADGGDGTLAAAESVGFRHVPLTVAGPTGSPNVSGYAVRAGTAVIELADACGIVHLPGGVKAPLTATSRGLGEVLAAALDDPSVTSVVMGIGGSASNDGGAGMLAALGARLRDADCRELPDGGGALVELAALDLSGLHLRLREVSLTVACDVNNPLLGETGAVAIFGPQKGAGEAERVVLEAGLARFASLVTAAMGRDDTGLPGAGAAGGVGYAAQAILGAAMRPGVELVLDLIGFDSLCEGAALVVTGEGSLDRQTLLGKTPAGVARAAQAHGIPVVALCGRALLSGEDVAASGIAQVYALTDLEPDPAICMSDAARLLRTLSAHMANEWLSD